MLSSQFIAEGKIVWNWKQLVALDPQLRAVEKELTACTLACAQPLYILIQFRTQTKGMITPTVGWVFHIS